MAKQKTVKGMINDRVKKRANSKMPKDRFYNLNSILGNTWSNFFVITGSRMTGKSYAVTEFICRQKKKKKDNVKCYWMRISETSTKAMLANKAARLVDPDLYRKYNLDLTTKGMDVFNHGKPFMQVIPLSQFAKLKGVAFYDKDYKGEYILVLDEFQLETGEKRTSFDILYNFIGMIENIARTTKTKIRVFLMANTLAEASTILKAFNFIPNTFGRFYLKSKKCVIDNLEPTDEYLQDRKGSLTSILGGDAMSNYTNDLNKDRSMLHVGRIQKITGIIKFSKDSSDWYSIFDGNVIRRWKKGEGVNEAAITYMFPYLGGFYSKERRQIVIDLYDTKVWKFDSLITQSYFSEKLRFIRKT